MVPKPPPIATRTVASRPLPPLPKLRVKNPNIKAENPCTALMSSVLGCWASSGFTTEGCARIEAQLRACMDRPVPVAQKKSAVNYHLSRMYPKMIGPHKKK